MTHSEQWYQRALKVTPGGVHSPVRSLKNVDAQPIFFSYGDGAYLHDVDGKSYVDFCLSFGPHILGHCPEVVTRALREQVGKALSFGACHPLEVELSERILQSYPFLQKVRLVNSGTEAVMTAIRTARAFTRKSKIIKFDGCYHGHSDSLLSKAGSGVAALNEASSLGVTPSQVSDTLTATFDDLSEFEALLEKWKGDVAAVLLEPVPANNGLHVPRRKHLQAMMELAHRHQALVIFDEVITGFRLSLSGASGYFDLTPDLVTLGKIIGGGLPLAAVAGRTEILDQLAPLGGAYQAGTLSGNPLATAAGCAILTELAQNPPYQKLELATQDFADELERLVQKFDMRVPRIASMFWLQASEGEAFPPQIGDAQRALYGKIFRKALKVGVYLPPSPYEVGFLSTAHLGRPLEQTLEKLESCLK
ncbi:MAG: glutamate-1-semialdehyde 2,1-aminomutase [Bdellovibrionales bacterium]|nr:glutamate-1-semialdehyde 2,1-aminomutase [Bdellovibrionales bacterium]